jgi:4-hydroxyphenylpyruvate dioxygenase
MNFFPDWIYTRSDAQEAMLERFKAFSQLSTSLGAECLNVSTQCDGIPDENLAKENFRELCRIAAADGATVGLEFVPWSPIDTVKKAWSIIGGVDHPCGGLVFDIFHYFKGGSQRGELKDVPLEKIFAVHLTDVREADVDVATLCRNYRVLPGEGVFVFDEIIDYFVQRGYDRYYALEILNKDCRADQCLGIAMRGKEVLENMLMEATQRVEGA